MVHAVGVSNVPVTPAQLMRPGIGQNASCAMSGWLTSRPGAVRSVDQILIVRKCVLHSLCRLIPMIFR